MSFLGTVLRKIPGVPKPRSGKLTQVRFRPEQNQSPIRDAVQLTNTVTEGGKTVLAQETTRVTLKNGNAWVGDGEEVKVLDPKGQEMEAFRGSIDVSEEHVTVHEERDNRSQTFAANGQAVLDDNGLLVQLSPDGNATSLKAEGGTWVPGSTGKVDGSTIKFKNGDVAYPLFEQSWLMAGPDTDRSQQA